MYITKEKFQEIKDRHSSLLVVEGDTDDALAFVQELLEAEADALKEKAAYATVSIREMEQAAQTVFSMGCEIVNEEFGAH